MIWTWLLQGVVDEKGFVVDMREFNQMHLGDPEEGEN